MVVIGWTINSESRTYVLHSSFLSAYIEYVVPSNKCITVLILQLTIDIFFGLLESYVHVAVKTG